MRSAQLAIRQNRFDWELHLLGDAKVISRRESNGAELPPQTIVPKSDECGPRVFSATS